MIIYEKSTTDLKNVLFFSKKSGIKIIFSAELKTVPISLARRIKFFSSKMAFPLPYLPAGRFQNLIGDGFK